jgi:hypothetical protein
MKWPGLSIPEIPALVGMLLYGFLLHQMLSIDDVHWDSLRKNLPALYLEIEEGMSIRRSEHEPELDVTDWS